MKFHSALRRSLLIAFLGTGAPFGSALGQLTDLGVPLEIVVPQSPVPALAGDSTLLVYEIHITNLRATPLSLSRLDIFDADNAMATLATYSDTALINRLSRPGSASVPNPATLLGNSRAVVYVWISMPRSERTPRTLRHRFTVDVGSPAAGAATHDGHDQVLDRIDVPVSRQTVSVVGPPLRGDGWIAVNGPSNTSIHRRALFALEGKPRISQRFAIDWLRAGANESTFHDDSTRNENWWGYGADVLAVSDGVVTTAVDSIPDNAPYVRPPTVTLGNIAGNHVIVRIAPGRYAYFGHLKPGSVRVRVGQRVRRGQLLGLVGNSGNSSAPHLHFHVSGENSPLAAEGMPFVFDRVRILGRVPTYDPKAAHGAFQRRVLPLELMVIGFP